MSSIIGQASLPSIQLILEKGNLCPELKTASDIFEKNIQTELHKQFFALCDNKEAKESSIQTFLEQPYFTLPKNQNNRLIELLKVVVQHPEAERIVPLLL